MSSNAEHFESSLWYVACSTNCSRILIDSMIVHCKKANNRMTAAGFTLIEVLIAFVIFGIVSSGVIYGYVQANRMAEWSSMSLAAQSLAAQGMEQARAAKWDTQVWPQTNGDFLGQTQYFQVDTNDVPTTGAPLLITNYLSITNISASPPLRQIRSDVVWTFPLTGRVFTNTVITLRAPDQ
jgi:prepilin-type N-terminal cleavage/methylation domain-containing protein